MGIGDERKWAVPGAALHAGSASSRRAEHPKKMAMEPSGRTTPAPGAPAPAGGPTAPRRSDPPRYPNLDKLLQVELPVIAVLAERRMSLEETLSLREGSIIAFKKNAADPLDVYVQDRRIGRGKTIKVAERFGVHLSEITNPEDLLARLR